MMQTGVRLRQDTETTLPELPKQHRIREKEEELHGLESVHMAESETKCTAPGLNTLEPECVTANSRVSDLHHTEASLIKTETDLCLINPEDLKTESSDFTELTCVTNLHPDEVKREPDDGTFIKAEHISVFPDIKCVVVVKSGEVKLESSAVFVGDQRNTGPNGAAVDEKGETRPWQHVGESSSDSRKLDDNLSNLIQDVQIHVCRCSQSKRHFLKDSPFNRHERNGDEKSYKCERCEKRPQTEFFRHEQANNVQKPYKCDHCEKRFSKKCQLKFHKAVHTGEKPYKCDQCEKRFSRKSHLESHHVTHTGEKPFKCDKCEKSFSWKHVLKAHQNTRACNKVCKFDQYRESFSWKSHLKCHHSIYTGENGLNFSHQTELLHPVQIHHVQKPYKCDQCEKSFSRKSCLEYHMAVHTGEKPFKCDQCESSFSRKFGLKWHQKIHAGEKPYKCDQCEKSFSRKYYLESHCITHTSEKPFKCDQCERSYARKFDLKWHQKIHGDEKPYKCDQCEKSFSRKSHLESHCIFHTGEKPFKCDQCERSFSWKQALKAHQKTHRRKSQSV